jgi:folate-binding Fe-S cluster repair protein YgfZ
LKKTIDKENISKNSVIIELHISAIDILTKHLKTYKLRSNVNIKSYEYITILENDLLLMNQNNHLNKIENQDKDNLKNVSTDSTSGDPGSNPDTGLILSAVDPRISSLGQRYLYISNSNTKNSAISTTLFDYRYLRLLYGINEGLEIVDKIPLECNLDLFNYIDFAKGTIRYMYMDTCICIYLFI